MFSAWRRTQGCCHRHAFALRHGSYDTGPFFLCQPSMKRIQSSKIEWLNRPRHIWGFPTKRFFSSVLADLHAHLHSIHELFHLEYTFRLRKIFYDQAFPLSVEMASAAFFGRRLQQLEARTAARCVLFTACYVTNWRLTYMAFPFYARNNPHVYPRAGTACQHISLPFSLTLKFSNLGRQNGF